MYDKKNKYDSHVKRCSTLDDDLRSQKTTRTSNSRRSNTISDIESVQTQTSQSTEKTIKRNVRLKDCLKKCIEEIEYLKRVNGDRMLENDENVHKITLLNDERIRLITELNKVKDSLINERDRLKHEFNGKLVAHKEQLERRFTALKNNDTGHLKEAMDEMQKRIDRHASEKDEIRKGVEKEYMNKEMSMISEIENATGRL